MLQLAEQLFLLALNEGKGNVSSSALLRYGLAGGLLADLALAGRISFADGRVSVHDTEPTGDPALDAVLHALDEAGRERKLTYWLKELASRPFRDLPANRLVERGILRKEKKCFLWAASIETPPEEGAPIRYQIKRDLRAVVLAGQPPEPQQIVLLSLIRSCWMLNRVFTKDERKAATRRIRELIREDPIGQSIARALKEIEEAAAAAVTLAAAAIEG